MNPFDAGAAIEESPSTEAGDSPFAAQTDRIVRPTGCVAAAFEIVVLLPVFNDWEAVNLLLPRLDAALGASDICARIVLVDDGSTASTDAVTWPAFPAIRSIAVLRLAHNVGHQRAIAAGLRWVAEHREGAAIVVMDADGEDNPADVPRLVAACAAGNFLKVIFAARTRRSESRLFCAGYYLYRWAHHLLTGKRVTVGNFSIIPPGLAASVAEAPGLDVHYAAAVLQHQIAHDAIPTRRGKRLAGSPRMNYAAYALHGLRAMSLYAEQIVLRMMAGTLAALLVSAAVLGAAAFFTNAAATHPWIALGFWMLILCLAQLLSVQFVLLLWMLCNPTEAATRDTGLISDVRTLVREALREGSGHVRH